MGGGAEGAERKESREEQGSCGWGAGWACENWTVQGQGEGPCLGPEFEGRGMPPAPGLVQLVKKGLCIPLRLQTPGLLPGPHLSVVPELTCPPIFQSPHPPCVCA